MLSIHLALGTGVTETEYLAAERLCTRFGFRVVSTDRERGDTVPPDYLADCDVVVANLCKREIGEPDFRVIYELGIAHSRQKRLYGYMLDTRDILHRHPYGFVDKRGLVLDSYGLRYSTAHTIGNLMYTVPTKIITGNLERCLRMVYYDWIEDCKQRGQRITPAQDNRFSRRREPDDPHLAYLAGFECFYLNGEQIGLEMIRECRKNGFAADFPPIPLEGMQEVSFAELMNPLVGQALDFDNDQCKILLSDITIANVNPYHGLLPDSGTVFELGMAAGLGQLCVSFFSERRDVLRVQMPRAHGWLEEKRDYDPERYYRDLLELFGRNTVYVRGDFVDAVRYIRRALKSKRA